MADIKYPFLYIIGNSTLVLFKRCYRFFNFSRKIFTRLREKLKKQNKYYNTPAVLNKTKFYIFAVILKNLPFSSIVYF